MTEQEDVGNSKFPAFQPVGSNPTSATKILNKEGEEMVKKGKEKRLNMNQKKAIQMQVYQGFSQRQVACALNLSEKTVSSWTNHNELFMKIRDEEEAKAARERKRRYKGAAQIAINKLIDLIDSDDDKAALAACKDILNRAGDKPSDKLSLSGSVETTGKLDDILRQLSDNE